MYLVPHSCDPDSAENGLSPLSANRTLLVQTLEESRLDCWDPPRCLSSHWLSFSAATQSLSQLLRPPPQPGAPVGTGGADLGEPVTDGHRSLLSEGWELSDQQFLISQFSVFEAAGDHCCIYLGKYDSLFWNPTMSEISVFKLLQCYWIGLLTCWTELVFR